MAITDLRDDVDSEVSKILASDFKINITETSAVPHSGDGAITFPNLDDKQQSCKTIKTCVLYIDVRRSTTLNLSHRPETVAKLYSAFVRAMTKCARYFGGHVRGIIGDRLMVIFDVDRCFHNAVECAVLMNSTAKYIIDKHFKSNEFECGIGIDFGRMLVTKTGVRRQGAEVSNYRNLVWLGRPANVASKLTDLANKEGETVAVPRVECAYGETVENWRWHRRRPDQFISGLEVDYTTKMLRQKENPIVQAFFMSTEILDLKQKTPPILMTQAVWEGLKKEDPQNQCVTNNWFTPVKVDIPGYSGNVVGADVILVVFRDGK